MYEAANIVNFEITTDDTVLDFEIGKKPKKVEVYNETNDAYGYWVDTMADGEFLVVVADTGATQTVGKKTSNGVTIIDEVSNDANGEEKKTGFSIGKLTAFNATADAADVLQVTVAY